MRLSRKNKTIIESFRRHKKAARCSFFLCPPGWVVLVPVLSPPALGLSVFSVKFQKKF
jgi:hypothetical protein